MAITSLTSLLQYATSLKMGERGMLALDLDYTLIKPPLIASDHLKFFLEANNAIEGYTVDAHHPWFGKLHKELAYQPCETVEVVEEVLEAFRAKGWQVKIFTARKGEGREITFKHILSAGLKFDEQDVIFCGETDKDVKIDEVAGPGGKLHVVGADDQLGHVQDVQRLARRVEEFVVHFFPFAADIPSPQLSDLQRRELRVALRARLPEEQRADWRDEKVLRDRDLHKLVRAVAEEDGWPFEEAKLN